jgi:hypothetical protein
MEGSTSLFTLHDLANKSNMLMPTSTTKGEEEEMENLDSPDMLTLNDSQPIENSCDEPQQWKLFGQVVPKNEVIFFCQVIILYIVIIACIINLSLHNGDSNLYTALLSSSLGILLPSPRLSHRKLGSQLEQGLRN